MLLQSNIKRPNGTVVEFDGPKGPRTILYHFKPQSTDPDAPHVCDVGDDDHAEILLGIAGKAFSFAKNPAAAKVTKIATPAPEPVQAPIQVPPIQADADADDDGADPDSGSDTPSPQDEKAALVAEYTRLYGGAPHPAAKIETLKARIAEKLSSN